MTKTHTFHLAEDDLKLLQAATNDARPEVKRRAEALLMLHNGSTPVAVRAAFKLRSRTSLFNWVKKWQEGGLEGLARRPQSGRPRHTDATYRAQLEAITVMEPKAFGYSLAGWTVAALNAVLYQKTGVTLSDQRLCHLLHEMGFTYQRLSKSPLPALPFRPTMEAVRQWRERFKALPPQPKATYGWRKQPVD
jgi:transposase